MAKAKFRTRRVIGMLGALVVLIGIIIANPASYEAFYAPAEAETTSSGTAVKATGVETSDSLATEVLKLLEIKGRAPKTDYSRDKFYGSWPIIDGCSLRQRIIKREVGDSAVLGDNQCDVVAGEFDEPYTGTHLVFSEKAEFSKKIQIDHVVALSDAWQKGAQYMDADTRYAMATDPLNLLAADSSANQQKSDGDAATWLPPNKAFRCQYVARQVSVKYKYGLWVTEAEHQAIAKILENCPNEPAVGVKIKE